MLSWGEGLSIRGLTRLHKAKTTSAAKCLSPWSLPPTLINSPQLLRNANTKLVFNVSHTGNWQLVCLSVSYLKKGHNFISFLALLYINPPFPTKVGKPNRINFVHFVFYIQPCKAKFGQFQGSYLSAFRRLEWPAEANYMNRFLKLPRLEHFSWFVNHSK